MDANVGAMSPAEQVEMMRRCSAKIKELRVTIDQLRPRAEAYDNMAKLLNAVVRAPQQGYGERDHLAWLLDRRAAAIEERKEKRSKPADAKPAGEQNGTEGAAQQ